MGFPKHHGITLAANSWIENLHVEKLAADPMPITASRVWHNTTERAIKYSVLDAGGAVITRTITSAEDLQAAIGTLNTAIAAETTARTSADDAEQAARIAAVDSLTTALAAETTARIQAVADEATARAAGDAAEATARVAADAVGAAAASDQLSTEQTSRLAGDAALGVRIDDVQAELNGTQAGAGLNVDGTFTAPENTTYLGDATTLKAADVLLDTAITAEAATRAAQVVGLGSALANEAQLRSDGDANLQAQLQAWVQSGLDANAGTDAAETAARIAADSALQSELDVTQAAIGLNTDGTMGEITTTNFMNGASTVFGAAFALDVQLQVVTDAVAAESVARATADTNFNTSLQGEIVARAASDDLQQQEMNRIEAGAGLETDGTYVAPTGSNYLSTAISLKDADYVLDAAVRAVADQVTTINDVALVDIQGQITAEVTRATTAEGAEAATRAAAVSTLTTAVTTEAARAAAAESDLAGDIAAEAAARGTAVAGAIAAVSAEVTRATAAEGVLNTAIGAEVTRATGVETGLQSQITAIVAASGEGAAALKSALNGDRFNYKSPVAALSHTITHNLNTEFYTLQVMVEDGTGVYRNDIVPVEEVDPLNSLKITLTEARKVKVSVVSNAPLV